MRARRLSACLPLMAAVLVAVSTAVAAQTPPTEPTPAPPTPAQPTAPAGPTQTTAPIAPPAASIVVDAESGEVISARNPDAVLPPASVTKMLTALVVRRRLPEDRLLWVTSAATKVPARRLNMPVGTRWRTRDLLRAMLLCSCNDAAVVLAQGAGHGTVAGFATELKAEARRLGLSSEAVVQDPAGLDDEFSVGGGNLLSARDLAIIARAYMADPVLAAIAKVAEYRWIGGDGKPHVVKNQNKLLGNYEGALGLKTGYTRRAGATFVGAATQDRRRLISVVLRSAATYAHTRELLDKGFMLLAAGQGTGQELPPVPEAVAPPGTRAPDTTTSVSSVPAVDGQEPGPEAAAPTSTRATPKDTLPLTVVAGAAGVAAALVGLALLARWRLRSTRRKRSRARGRALARTSTGTGTVGR